MLSGGDALIDFVPALAQDQDAFIPRVGGSCLNVAVALSRLGAPTGFIGGVSSDLFGEMIASHLAKAGVDLQLVTRSSDETTLAFVKLDGADARYAFYDEHSAARRWTYDAGALTDASVEALHIGSVTLINEPSASNYELLVGDLRERAVISFDPNCRPTLVHDPAMYRMRMERLAAMSHIVRFSEEDFAFLYPNTGETEVASELLEGSTRVVLISRGANGSSAFVRDGKLDLPAQDDIKIVDTIGAGDTFQAGFLYALRSASLLSPTKLQRITGEQVLSAMTFAAKAAAVTCTRSGCNPPTASDLGIS